MAPMSAYQIQCGSVMDVAIANGGTGMVSPVASASGGGGSGLTFGTITPVTGIVGYTVLSGGLYYVNGVPGWPSAPQWRSPTPAAPDRRDAGLCGSRRRAWSVGSSLTAAGANYVSPVVTISQGHDEVLVPTVSGGAITGIAVTYGGTGFASGTFPVIITDSSGTGAWYTATVVNGTITTFNKTSGGSGYSSTPTILVTGGSNGATATATQSGGEVTAVTIVVQQLSTTNTGGHYAAPPTITVSPASDRLHRTDRLSAPAGLDGRLRRRHHATVASYRRPDRLRIGLDDLDPGHDLDRRRGAILVPVLGTGGTAGQIMSVTVVQGAVLDSGAGTYPGSVAINFNDSGGSGSGAAATAVVSNGIVQSVTMTNNGSGYVNPCITIAHAGSSASIKPIFGSYVPYVPVTNGGTGYTSPPTITITDTGGGTGAVLSAIMSGASSGDTFTYSAPAGWLTATIGGLPLGGLQAVSDAAMLNSVGQYEALANMPAFAATPTLIAGASVGEQPSVPWTSNATAQNRMKSAYKWAKSGTGALTLDTYGNPQSWTVPASTVVYTQAYGPETGNAIDYMCSPAHFGQWTLQYDDSAVNTSSATSIRILPGSGSSFAANFTTTPISQSGPNAGTGTVVTIPAANVTVSGGAVTAISLSGISAPSLAGYQGAGITILGTTGTNAGAVATVNGSGTITGITVAAGGAGYTSGSTTAIIYGTAVSGTQVTAVFDIEYITTPTCWNPEINLIGSNVNGTWTVGNLWLVAPDVLAGRTAVALSSINRNNQVATDGNVVAYLTAANGNTAGALRFMDVVNFYGGQSNFVDPFDFAGITPLAQPGPPAVPDRRWPHSPTGGSSTPTRPSGRAGTTPTDGLAPRFTAPRRGSPAGRTRSPSPGPRPAARRSSPASPAPRWRAPPSRAPASRPEPRSRPSTVQPRSPCRPPRPPAAPACP